MIDKCTKCNRKIEYHHVEDRVDNPLELIHYKIQGNGVATPVAVRYAGQVKCNRCHETEHMMRKEA